MAYENVRRSLNLIQRLVAAGVSQRAVAAACGVGYSTFREYAKREPELARAIERGKIERSLQKLEGLEVQYFAVSGRYVISGTSGT